MTAKTESRVANTYKISMSQIIIDESKNPRQDYGDLSGIKATITERGIDKLEPIKVRYTTNKDNNGNKLYELVHGYRRCRSWHELKASGFDLTYIVCVVVPQKYSELDEAIDHVTSNSGKELNAIELAIAIKRISNLGRSNKEISNIIGKPEMYISNALKVAECSEAVKEVIREGFIKTTLVIDIIRKYGLIEGEKVILDSVYNMLNTATTPKDDVQTTEQKEKEKPIPTRVTERQLTKPIRESKFVKIMKKVHSVINNPEKEYDDTVKEKLEITSQILDVFESATSKTNPEDILEDIMSIFGDVEFVDDEKF